MELLSLELVPNWVKWVLVVALLIYFAGVHIKVKNLFAKNPSKNVSVYIKDLGKYPRHKQIQVVNLTKKFKKDMYKILGDIDEV